MYRFNNRFNDTEIDRYVSIFCNIKDIYYLEIEFSLWKIRYYNIFRFNSIDIFDIVLNSTEVRLRCNLVGYNDNDQSRQIWL